MLRQCFIEAEGLAPDLFLGRPAGPPEQMSRWPNESFSGLDAVSTLLSNISACQVSYKALEV